MLNLVQHLNPFGVGLLRRGAPRNDSLHRGSDQDPETSSG
jgi:hypothetical protein